MLEERLQKWTKRLGKAGPRNLVRWARWALVRAEGAAWERYFGVDTARPFDNGVYAERRDCIRYQPLPWLLLRNAIDALPVTREDVFLDYGCGMGRVLLMVARREVKRVMGIELFAQLADIARQNVNAARPRLRSPVEIIVDDATAWEVPDDVTVAFLFNPFVGTVMAAAQRRLADSLARKPRRLRVVYAHADDQPNLFADCPWLRPPQRVGVGPFKGMNVLVYESRPAALSMKVAAQRGAAGWPSEPRGAVDAASVLRGAPEERPTE